MKKSVYLVNLVGQGDQFITLVTEDVWNWILSPYESTKSGYNETLPEAVKKEMLIHHKKAEDVFVSRGSYENDRAIQAPGYSFDTIKEAMTYIRDNNLVLEEEFSGCLY